MQWLVVVGSCVAGTLIGWAGWQCRNLVSATSYTLIGVVNKLLTVVLSVLFLDKHASFAGGLRVPPGLLAQLEQPIVHGMWTAGRLHALLRQSLVDDAPERIASFEISFESPLELGAELRLQLWKTGTDNGQIQCELRASTLTENGVVTVAQAKALVHPPRTAYVFPGQGIQSQGMGMELYQSSRAARAVWDRADAHTREALGFSILRVVQQNPAHLRIGRTSYRHPVGVLHLTQFTQVAMSIMAQAQVAWIKEEGLFVPDAITCGHSVGEYNALGAVLGVIPLEQTITVVWQRGLAMHELVQRDKQAQRFSAGPMF